MPYVYRAADERPRVEIAGGRVVSSHGFGEVIPAMSRADFSRLEFGKRPHEAELEGLVSDLYAPGTVGARRYFDSRKIVSRELADGRVVASVTSNVWDKLNAPQVFGPTVGERWVAGKGQRRLYSLAQVLTDPYLTDKFALTPKQVNTARSMAVANASAAAAYLQGILREQPDFVKYEVTAGKYARSKKWAKDSIAITVTDSALVPVHMDSAIIGENLFIYGPGPVADRWSVFGPIWYAAELKMLYAVVARAGPAQACFALGIEITLLGLDITDRGIVMSPSVTLHTGPQDMLPQHSSVVTQELLSSSGRAKLASMSDSLEPVYVDGEQCACAVRISASRVLVNTHVLQAGAVLEVQGGEVMPQRMISKDLWVARSHRANYQNEWTLRTPMSGEQVVVCYLRGNSIQYTSPMSVRTTDGVTVIMSLTSELRAGMSGGAIVALHDMALLGVYSGVGAQQAVGAVFSQEHYTDLCTSDAASEISRFGGDGQSNDMYVAMRSRGLGRLVDRVIGALEPVYDGRTHVGMGYHIAGDFRTTCDAEAAPITVGDSRRNLVFSDRENGVFSSKDVVPSGFEGISVIRRAQYGEKVFVVGRDAEGPYTTESAVVRHIGVAGKVFYVNETSDVGDLPLHGGLLVAVSDGAVVGQYVAVTSGVNMGCVARCVSVEASVGTPTVGSSETVVEWLARTFPMINPGTWPVDLIEEVFTHASVQRYKDPGKLFNVGNNPLAFVGDAVAKMTIGLALREQGVPHSQWQRVIQMRQTDKHFAQVAEEFGLQKWLRVGNGVTLPPGCKAHASLLEALLGAVYMRETLATVEQFCAVLGITLLEETSSHSRGSSVEVLGSVGSSSDEDVGLG